MKLPDKNSLKEKEHLFLYEHDLMELHNPNVNSFEYQRYKTRIDEIIKHILMYVEEGGKVAEIGCAQGNMSLILAENGRIAFALDLRHPFLTYMMLKYEKGKLFPLAENAENLPFKDNSLDGIIVAELLEHTIFPHLILRESNRVLKKG